MATLGRYVTICLVWLTMAMTLIAGTPHVHCQCPNGNIKPFCLSMFSSESTCCCDGSCCQGQAATQRSKDSCCAATQSNRSHAGLGLTNAGCMKQWEQAKAAAPGSSSFQYTGIIVPLAAPALTFPLPTPAPRLPLLDPARFLSPPDDILARYLHLLI